jgi:hypothetical protein
LCPFLDTDIIPKNGGGIVDCGFWRRENIEKVGKLLTFLAL